MIAGHLPGTSASESAAPPFDAACRAIVARRPDAAVAWVLMAALAYYEDDDPILTDACFDRLCRELAARWHAVRHPHRHLLTLDDLRAGTAYALDRDAVPSLVRAGLASLRRDGPEVVAERETAPAPAQARAPGQLALF